MLEVKLPRIDVNDTTSYINKIYVKDGDMIEKEMPLLEIETAKVTETLYAPESGVIKFQVSEGDRVEFGSVIYRLYKNKEEYENHLSSIAENKSQESKFEFRATKKALLKAQELGINIESIRIDGIIREQDVEEFNKKLNKKILLKTPKFSYDRERVVIIGAGNGAEVVLDILLDDRDKYVVGLADDFVSSFEYFNIPVISNSIMDFPIKIDRNAYDTVIISIGSNLKSMQLRTEIYNHYKKQNIMFTNAISKSAEIRRFTKIGEGNIIGSMVYIGTSTVIGNNNSISYGAMIGHHNIIGNHNLLGPNIVVSGSVKIGSNCIISAGTAFINKVSIGNNVVFPINFAVTKDLEDDTFIQIKNGKYELKKK